MRRGWAWAAVIMLATILDLGTRLIPGLPFVAVLWLEAAIFLVTAAALFRMYEVGPAVAGWRRTLGAVLILSFVLGAVRAALWALGLPVRAANGIIFFLGLAAWLAWLRGRSSGSATGTDSEPDETKEDANRDK